MRAVLCAAGLLTFLALPSVATAHRAPTSGEAKAITSAINAYVKNPSSHAASDNKVAKIVVSTVDPRFATAHLTSVSGNSTALVGKAASQWKVLSFGGSTNFCEVKHPPPGFSHLTMAQYRKMLQDFNCSYSP